jgi:hypothetical protein
MVVGATNCNLQLLAAVALFFLRVWREKNCVTIAKKQSSKKQGSMQGL